jgi:2-methylcitrate dehydratase PrpD
MDTSHDAMATTSAAPETRPPGMTERLAHFTSSTPFAALPAATVDYTKKLVLDGIGCLLAGIHGGPGQTAARAVARMRSADAGQAGIVVDGTRASARDAAFVNGITLYSVGVNDIHRGSTSHPGGCVVPVVLAMGEWLRTPGTEMIAAMVMGYELMGRLGAAMIPAHWDRGFHPTGTFGAFGATAAASRLLGLDAQRTTWAFGIAGSQAAGNKAFQADGSLTMVFHAGRSAENGVEAALLAQEGFTGPHTVLEDKNGFCRAGADDCRLDALVAGLGERYEIDATSFRPFYGCTLTIAGSGAIAQIIARHPSQGAADVAQVTVHCHPSALREINDPHPETLLAARLSMQFNVALVVERRDVFVGDITDEDLANPVIRGLLPRIALVNDPAMTMWGNSVHVRFRDGTEDRAEILLPKGDPENPMSWDDMETKFLKLTAPIGDARGARRIIDAVRSLERSDGAALMAVVDAMARSARRTAPRR